MLLLSYCKVWFEERKSHEKIILGIGVASFTRRFFLSACSSPSPSEADIQTAIAQTAEAMPTNTVVPTDTPEPTKTPRPTNTPGPTSTPRPTSTSEPTNTPELWPVLRENQLRSMTYIKDEITGDARVHYSPSGTHFEAYVSIEANGDFHIDSAGIWKWDGRRAIEDYDWLNVASIVFNVSGEVYDLPICKYYKDVYLESEVFSPCPEDFDVELMLKIARSGKVLVRFDGHDGNHDYLLTKKEKDSLVYARRLYHNLLDGTIRIKDGIKSKEEIWWVYAD